MNLAEQLLGRIRERRRRIVFIGDVLVDRWVHGYAAPCQDGCSKFVQESTTDTPGGAANAERSISNWGVDTSLYGQADNDQPVKCRYVDGNKIVFRADSNEQLKLVAWYTWARDLALEMIGHASAVLLSDYDKGFLTPGFIAEVIALCYSRGIPCVTDCKRSPDMYSGIVGGCVLKYNEDYMSRYEDALTPLLTEGKTQSVETYGKLSPQIWENNDVHGICSNLPDVSLVNHVGAGDCFAAHLTLALAYGFSLKKSAALAHSAGRVYVQHPHNRPPTPAEIAADLASATAQ